jgi:type I restriction-modification system DNA methylase subunit
MDAAEYKHVVLGLIFLKYISDAFEAQHAQLEAEQAQGADPEDPDEYRALNIFWVPPEARWAHLKARARQPTIGQVVDDAMAGIERDNASLKGVLPKDYARPALDKERLGQLIDLISNIRVGDEASRAKDVLGRVYEYFLSQFASAEGKKGASSTRRAAWSSSWSRCSNPTAVGCTTPAAAPQACSCSRWSSSARTPPVTATVVRPVLTSRSTVRNRTTPPGGWRA